MDTWLVAHGAWSAGWAWKKMRPRLRAEGIELWTPTYTGVGERAHLAHPGITLDTHIADITSVLEWEDLADVSIVAHSYGGMVGTGIVDRAAARIRAIVYLDAFVPANGQSLFDLIGPDGETEMRSRASKDGDGWRVSPNPTPPDTQEKDVGWITPRRMPQPLGTFSQPIELLHDTSAIPRSYIYCQRSAPGDVFAQFADKARSDPQWQYRELDASHNPHITCPDALCRVLLELNNRS